MSEWIGLDQIDAAAKFLRSRLPFQPKVGMILGSGLGEIAELIAQPILIPFSEIPNWPRSTVEGHKGRLVIGEWEGQKVLISQGRVHYYEGYSMAQVAFPVRVMQRLGIEILIVTNAAGAVNPEYEPGDLMLITDHLNLIGMAGLTPLRGANLDELGPRFPDMSQAYDRTLCDYARQAAAEHNIRLRQGIYICLAGPSFETPADLRFLRQIGADAVGMSTVPEVTAARHGGLRVLGISGISNKANLDGNTITTHEEVLQAGQIIVPKLIRILRGVLQRLALQS
ncbi:MAG: purine-nucleoside phosphorylase [Anaerolineae bacterium]|nr:MAG: purine-nucleoside phosphorylase [Anaerolineae bacterium]